jgi:glycosyltransferase involved in cell wall biosynthesis
LQAGFSAEHFAIKPNFVSPDLGMAEGTGGYAVFVGRLSTEKGIDTLLTAWAQNLSLPPLKIVGDGPMAQVVRAAAEADPRITWMGARPAAETQEIIGDAALLVFPSVWYEGLPKTIIEAFSRGTPVVASQLGAMTELIDHDRTGLLFEAGNAFDLAAMVLRLTNNQRCDRTGISRLRIKWSLPQMRRT